ncbi:MAG: sel1 repeat family protein [Sulfuritalea sp.]|nr:sel1 repeat family protein [Sulfuritalea sp.]
MGNGAPMDMDKAADWFQKAADQGLAHAQYNLGTMYADGRSVRRDAVKALELFQNAASQGLPKLR